MNYNVQQSMEQAEGALEALANVTSAYYHRLIANNIPRELAIALTLKQAELMTEIALRKGHNETTRFNE